MPAKLVCLGAFLCATVAFAQNTATENVNGDASAAAKMDPVAYVYVSRAVPQSSVKEIVGYAAATNGKLSPVPGSPVTADITSITVNGAYLFGSNTNGADVNTYAIEANGALTAASESNVTKYNWKQCGASGALFTNLTGSDLYDLEYKGNSCANNKYESLAIDKAHGALSNLGSGVYSSWLSQPASFSGNDAFAYSASCLGNMYWTIFGMERKSTGELSFLPNFSAALPGPKTGDFYCPSQLATDSTNHVAIALQPVNAEQFAADGGAQIGSFTVVGDGNLSTTNTRENMPVSKVGTALSMSISPGGDLLAVGGSEGLEIFHFRGAAPPTVEIGLLTTDEVDQVYWDKDNHLYAISAPKDRLRVYTITSTSHAEAPGSPYSIETPQSLAVESLPLP